MAKEKTCASVALQEMGILNAVRKIMRQNHVSMAVAMALYYNVSM